MCVQNQHAPGHALSLSPGPCCSVGTSRRLGFDPESLCWFGYSRCRGPGLKSAPRSTRMLVGWAQAGRRQRSFWNVVRAQGASPGEGRGEGCAGMSHRQHAVAAGRDRPLPSVHFCVWRLHPGRVQSTCHMQAHVRPGRHSLTAVSPSALGQHFDTDTQDLAGIEWAPNGCVLAAWDTCLEV